MVRQSAGGRGTHQRENKTDDKACRIQSFQSPAIMVHIPLGALVVPVPTVSVIL
jgi:hypothetical protein